MDERHKIKVVPQPWKEPAKTPTGEMRVIKRSNFWTKVIIGCVGAAVTAIVSGFVEARGQQTEQRADSNVVIVSAQLQAHIENENQFHEALNTQREEDREREMKMREDIAVMRAMMELELKQHRIPKNQWPTNEDVAPANPDTP